MNEYNVSDYSIFDNAIATNGVYEGEINDFSEAVADCKSNLSPDVFMGPIADSCQGIFDGIVSDAASMVESVGKVSNYLSSTNSAYQQGDAESSKEVTDVSDNNSNSSIVTDGAVSTGNSDADVPISVASNGSVGDTGNNPDFGVADNSVPLSVTPNVGGYASRPEVGFNISTDNKTYNLSASEFDEMCAVVKAECDGSKDDALAVASAILNRLDDPACLREYGTTVHSQVSAQNQFSVWSSGSYKKYLNGNYDENISQAVSDALSGVRNHEYLSFRANTSSYSNNMITSTGNKYK